MGAAVVVDAARATFEDLPKPRGIWKLIEAVGLGRVFSGCVGMVGDILESDARDAIAASQKAMAGDDA